MEGRLDCDVEEFVGVKLGLSLGNELEVPAVGTKLGASLGILLNVAV
jgi:hypothetical protein